MKKDYIIFWLGNIIFLLMALALLWYWKKLPPELPWFYSLPWGEKQLVNKWVFAAVLAGAWGCLWQTSGVAKGLGKNDEIVRTTTMSGGLIIAILYAASFVRVLRLFIK